MPCVQLYSSMHKIHTWNAMNAENGKVTKQNKKKKKQTICPIENRTTRPGTPSDFKWFHLCMVMCHVECFLYFVLRIGFMYHICMCIKHSVDWYVRGINAYKLNLYMLIHNLLHMCLYANVTVLSFQCCCRIKIPTEIKLYIVKLLCFNGRREHIEFTSFGIVSYHLDFIASQNKATTKGG